MSNGEETASRLDRFKWLVAFGLIVMGVLLDYFYAKRLLAVVELLGWLVLLGVAFYLAKSTVQGAKIWGFFSESRVELHKVVWPTREETVQSALVVVGIVIFTAILLWAIDSGVLRGMGWLIGTEQSP